MLAHVYDTPVRVHSHTRVNDNTQAATQARARTRVQRCRTVRAHECVVVFTTPLDADCWRRLFPQAIVVLNPAEYNECLNEILLRQLDTTLRECAAANGISGASAHALRYSPGVRNVVFIVDTEYDTDSFWRKYANYEPAATIDELNALRTSILTASLEDFVQVRAQ